MLSKKLKMKIMAVALTTAMTIGMSTSVFAYELLGNNHFENGIGLPWTEVENAPAHAEWEVSNGKFNITVMENGPVGKDVWDVQLRHKGLRIVQGCTYNVQFTIESPVDCKVYAKIGEVGGTYAEYWHNTENPWQPFQIKAGVPLTVNQTFKMDQPTSKTCEFAFHMANDFYTGPLPHKISFSNIHLDGPDIVIPPPIEPTNAIRVNQVGYGPYLSKVATLVSPSTSPVEWSLKNSAGTVVKTGMTVIKGLDHASGDNVHQIDFSSYRTIGKDYTLSVANSAVDLTKTNVADSMKFDIGTDLYSKMKYDAIKYFYHNRSGIAIEMPYADRIDLTRPAGHPNDIVKNASAEYVAKSGYWDQFTGTYTPDLTGGWYDGGDYGKYVVNGGISTWTMYNQYERALYKGNVKVAPFADGSMNIPESGNSVPDILDEARWNTELLLKMQIPAGNTLGGMVHHNVGDEVWSILPISPDKDTKERVLMPPTTAATLNMAAVASQASRLWKEYDPAFATKCIDAAKVAWDAAIANPARYAPSKGSVAGGAYGDDNVTDEFYWAAAELYITTGDTKYLDYMKTSDKYLVMPSILNGGEDKGVTGAFDWGNVGGLGTISLALAPNQLPAADLATAKANIAKAADAFIALEAKEGYNVPLGESAIDDVYSGASFTGYVWGSNSFINNNAIVMSYAYDLTNDIKYLNGASKAMDYLLGNNANVQSYVTGYGENPLEFPHHRFWANSIDDTFPKAPAGAISGGPNSGLQDPWVKGSGMKIGVTPAAKCFTDNIESWSTNEVTINGNAPFAWMTAYMDEQIRGHVPDNLKGDVNGDSNVNVIDYIQTKKYITGTITEFPSADGINAADVNGDTKINIFDYVLIKNYIAGKITKFPL